MIVYYEEVNNEIVILVMAVTTMILRRKISAANSQSIESHCTAQFLLLEASSGTVVV